MGDARRLDKPLVCGIVLRNEISPRSSSDFRQIYVSWWPADWLGLRPDEPKPAVPPTLASGFFVFAVEGA